VSALHRLPTVSPEHWSALYRQALAAGCGCVIGLQDERVASPDELVALALPGLVRLSALALLTDGTSDQPLECARALAREAAGVLRLLDRALAAHGRDQGYPSCSMGRVRARRRAGDRWRHFPGRAGPDAPEPHRLGRGQRSCGGGDGVAPRSPGGPLGSWRMRWDRCWCSMWLLPVRWADRWAARVASWCRLTIGGGGRVPPGPSVAVVIGGRSYRRRRAMTEPGRPNETTAISGDPPRRQRPAQRAPRRPAAPPSRASCSRPSPNSPQPFALSEIVLGPSSGSTAARGRSPCRGRSTMPSGCGADRMRGSSAPAIATGGSSRTSACAPRRRAR
jgi:hypothetical protein